MPGAAGFLLLFMAINIASARMARKAGGVHELHLYDRRVAHA
jgi:hypothetical protein